MFIKPHTSPFFSPPLILLLQDIIAFPGGSHCIHCCKYSHSIHEYSRAVFLTQANAFHKRLSSLVHMQFPLGATVKLL